MVAHHSSENEGDLKSVLQFQTSVYSEYSFTEYVRVSDGQQGSFYHPSSPSGGIWGVLWTLVLWFECHQNKAAAHGAAAGRALLC